MARTGRIPTLAAAAAVLAALAGGARAQEGPKAGTAAKAELTPPELYEAKRRDYLVQIAGKIETAASFAMNNKLKRTGLETWEVVLEFHPDHEKARRELGFERKGTDWVLNEAKRKKLEDVEDESEKKRVEFEKKLRDSYVGAARMLAELGELAEKASDADAARAHWKRALELDDQNPLANQKSGNRQVGGKWFTERSLNHKEFLKVYRASLEKAQKMAVAPLPADESTGIGERAGINVKKYKSKNFRVESNLSDAEIKDTLVWLERARRFYLDLFEIQDRFLDYEGQPDVFVIVTTPEQKDKLVDACDQIPEKDKSFKKKFTAIAVTSRLQLALHENGESATRHTVHTATHTFTGDTLGHHAPWLHEGLANAISAAIRNADLTVCYSGEGSTGGIHLDRISLEQAPQVLRELIQAKKDTPIGDFVKLPADVMNAQHIAKAWSIVMFLIEKDRAQARGYFERAGQGGGELSRDDKVLEQYFEDFQSWSDLDRVWREWALDVYKN
jgi:hypothetical protein